MRLMHLSTAMWAEPKIRATKGKVASRTSRWGEGNATIVCDDVLRGWQAFPFGGRSSNEGDGFCEGIYLLCRAWVDSLEFFPKVAKGVIERDTFRFCHGVPPKRKKGDCSPLVIPS